MHLNDQRVRGLIKQRRVGRHAAGNGLYLRVTTEGTGFWVFRYSLQGKRREITLGRYPEVSLADATSQSLQLKTGVRAGTDPLAERKRPAAAQLHTVDDLARDWLATISRKISHPEIPQRIYQKEIAPHIGELPMVRVKALDIRSILERVAASGRPTIANDTLMYLKQLFRHAQKLHLIEQSPAAPFTNDDAGGSERSRKRVLSWSELEKLFAAIGSHIGQFGRDNHLAVALLLMLGVRKNELLAAAWHEIDVAAGEWRLIAERTKTSKPLRIPLPEQAVTLLRELRYRAGTSDYLFPRRRATKRSRQAHVSPSTLNAAIGTLLEQTPDLEHFTVHDLRRTFRSLLAELKVPAHIAERCMNHGLRGIEGVYDHYDYWDERKDALQRLANHLWPLMCLQSPSSLPDRT